MTSSNSFQLNEIIHFQHHTGYITFISSEYLTLCVRHYPKPDEIAQFARSKIQQVNVIIYPQFFNLIQRTNTLLADDIKGSNFYPPI